MLSLQFDLAARWLTSEIDDYRQTGYERHRGEDYERESPPIRFHQSGDKGKQDWADYVPYVA